MFAGGVEGSATARGISDTVNVLILIIQF